MFFKEDVLVTHSHHDFKERLAFSTWSFSYSPPKLSFLVNELSGQKNISNKTAGMTISKLVTVVGVEAVPEWLVKSRQTHELLQVQEKKTTKLKKKTILKLLG